MTDINALLAAWRDRTDRSSALDHLFIIGCGKSGTTWLRYMIGNHPQIVANGEGSFAWRLLPHFFQAIKAFNEHQSHGQPEVTKVNPEDALITARLLVDGQFARYLEDAQQRGRDISTVRWVADKTPQHTISIPGLNDLYPDAKFIHIRRDPRDVAISGWFHDGVNGQRTFEQFVHHYMNEVWPLQVGAARRDGPGLGPERFFELKYEDLIDNTHANMERLFTFLGVDDSESTVESCVEAGSFQRLSGGRQRGDEDRSNFYRKGVAGDWVNHIPRNLAQSCCDRIAGLMRACGYDPDCQTAQDGCVQEIAAK